jgi:phenylpropionate dioxygenase-like ring-hydroxylating dioxygenase large terminal subunit
MFSRDESRASGTPSGIVSVVRLPQSWFILCASRELGRKPLARTLQGMPLVLFRTESGKPAALVDRCPHRNVPPVHGPRGGRPAPVRLPRLALRRGGRVPRRPRPHRRARAKSRCTASHATREQDGFVWVYSTPGVEPTSEPYRFPLLDAHGYSTVRRTLRAKGSLHSLLENTHGRAPHRLPPRRPVPHREEAQ